MLSFRSCFSPPIFRPIRSLLRLEFSLTPSRPFPFKPIFLPTHNRSCNMSSRPSAFDALMSGARAAAKKKPQSSSPQKRKTLDSNSIQNPKNLKSTERTFQSSEPSNDIKCTDIRDSEKTQEPANGDLGNGSGSEGVLAAKRMRIVSSQDKIAGWKKKVSLLKKKPGDFDPSSISCWDKGEPVPFLFLGLAFDMIAEETGRIVIL